MEKAPAPLPTGNDPNFDPDVQPSAILQAGWCGHQYAWKVSQEGVAVCSKKGCGATWLLQQ